MTGEFEAALVSVLKGVLDERGDYGPRPGTHPYMHDGCVVVGDEEDEYMLITTSEDDDSPGGNEEFYVGRYHTADGEERQGDEERQFITTCIATELQTVCRAMWGGTFG